DDEGRTRDIGPGESVPGWGAADETKASDYLNTMFFYDLNDSLGKKVRNFMRNVWDHSTPGIAKGMGAWLDRLEAHKETSYAALADELGGTPQNFFQNVYTPAMRIFFAALWKNPSLMAEINKRLQDQGLEQLGQELPRDVIVKELPFRAERWKTSAADRVTDRYSSRSNQS
ncbi:MAG: hypothetical protein WCO84_08565, partial [bacterium]